MSFRDARWLAVGTVVAALMASCDGDESDTGGAEQDSEEQLAASTGIDADRQPPAPPIPGATEGGVISVSASFGDALTSLDPTDDWFLLDASILSGLVTRSLTQYVYDPDLESMVLVPDIATDIGTPNDDFTEWTYTIRDGVRFEDGSEVTAADVAYGIMRSFDRLNFPDGPDWSNRYFLDGQTYRGPYRSGTDYDGVVVDGNTLTLKMERPFPSMPYWGAFPAMGPIPRSASDPDEYGVRPLATGPYKIADYTPGQSLRLVRNDQWDPHTDPGRHAYPDEYDFTDDQGQETVEETVDAAILDGSTQGKTSIQMAAPSSDVRTALDDAPDLLATGTKPCVTWIALDYRTIDDLRVRQAIGYAWPYAEILAASGQTLGVSFIYGRTILPPSTPGHIDYNPLLTEPGESDPEKSKEVLADAGLKPGEFTLKFTYDASDRVAVAVAEATVDGLTAGGFDVVAVPSPSQEIFRARESDPHAPYNLRHWTGWCDDWPSGSGSFLPSFASATSNPAFFSDPSVTAEIDRIVQLPLVEQPAAWGALDRRIETDFYPFVVLGQAVTPFLHGSSVGGVNNDSIFGLPTWKDVYVLR